MLPKDYEAGVSPEWAEGVLRHARHISGRITAKAGINKIRFYGVSAEAVLEKITLVREGTTLPWSYFGPAQSIEY